jgi:hypothetical protein
MKGMQIGGLFNAAADVKGLQIGGLVNAANDMEGLQIGGLINVADDVKGLQIGGLFNATDDMQGMQISGLFNAVDDMTGVQIGGLFNVADNMMGLQLGGLFNTAYNMQGVQIGGLFNVAGYANGLQIGGICNRSNTLRGVQIGLISINDTIEKGFPLSFVNIVKRGFYREWELSFSDYTNVALSYKMGMKRFYTIYSVGANFIEDNLWSVGFGFGNRTSLGSKFDFRPELISYNYYPLNFKNIQSVFATHLKFGFVYNFCEKFGLSLVPSVYVMHSSRKWYQEHDKVSPIDAFYTHEKENQRTTIGGSVSIGLNLR